MQIVKRSKDGLFQPVMYKWIEHDKDISEILNVAGFWGILYSNTSITDSEASCLKVALENLFILSGERIED